MAEETSSIEELQANLADYKQQLQQVETLLLSDHTNEELKEMYDNLTEVIQLTEDLLLEAGIPLPATAPPSTSAHGAAAAAAAAPDPAPAAAAAAGPSSSYGTEEQQQQQQLVTPAQLHLPAMLPASVADQIRKAQVKQALLGQGNPAWAVGAECLALYGGDGQYYKATVKSVTPDGKFVVTYEGYGNDEEVRAAHSPRQHEGWWHASQGPGSSCLGPSCSVLVLTSRGMASFSALNICIPAEAIRVCASISTAMGSSQWVWRQGWRKAALQQQGHWQGSR